MTAGSPLTQWGYDGAGGLLSVSGAIAAISYDGRGQSLSDRPDIAYFELREAGRMQKQVLLENARQNLKDGADYALRQWADGPGLGVLPGLPGRIPMPVR